MAEEQPFAEEPVAEEQPEHEPQVQTWTVEAPTVSIADPVFAERPAADLSGLAAAVDTTIAALQAFVDGELQRVRDASKLEVEEIIAERQRLVDEAATAGEQHLEEVQVHAERIIADAERQRDDLSSKAQAERDAELGKLQRVLAEREAQAEARAAEILSEAESTRREADELLATASQAQAQMLASFEQARTSLIQAAERTGNLTTTVHSVDASETGEDEQDAAAA